MYVSIAQSAIVLHASVIRWAVLLHAVSAIGRLSKFWLLRIFQNSGCLQITRITFANLAMHCAVNFLR